MNGSFDNSAVLLRQFDYPASYFVSGYFRTAIGLSVTLLPVLLLGPSSVIVYILLFMAGLFLLYGIRVLYRQVTLLEVTDTGIRIVGPIGWTIKWEKLGGFRLGYYSTRRDRENGWMQLTLTGKGVRLTVDSAINDFGDLVEISLRAANNKGLSLNPTTLRNLHILETRGALPTGATGRTGVHL